MRDKEDRFAINRMTGYMSICDGIIGIICNILIILDGLFIGFIGPKLGKKILAGLYFILSIADVLLLMILLSNKVYLKLNRFLLDLYGT